MNRIALADIARLHRSMQQDLAKALGRVVESSRFVNGPEVAAFEETFAAAHGAAGAVGCGSGTDAITLSLRALEIGAGDEVVVPAFAYAGTVEAVLHAGATPVFADVDPVTLLLTDESVDAVVSDLTRAVIPVHLYGHVVPFDRLRRWRRQGYWVIEDASHAPLATWRGEPVGSVGHVACFGFGPEMNLGALGDGGAVVGRDLALLHEVHRLGDHGRRADRYESLGWCSRLDEIQAAVLNAKLERAVDWNEARDLLADHYVQELPSGWLVPWEAGAVHHRLVIQHDDRDRLQAVLDHVGIETAVHYAAPVYAHPAFAEWGTPAPVAAEASTRVLSLPMDPLLRTTEVAEVCHAVLGSAARAA